MKKRKYLLVLPVIFAGVFLLRAFNTSGAYPDDQQINLIKKGELDLTYELFGAKGDGESNDYEAISAAHKFANDIYVNDGIMLTVKGTAGKEYYIGEAEKEIDVITNVDFGGAKFIVDDFIDGLVTVNKVDTSKALFNITSPMSYMGTDYIDVAGDLPAGFKLSDDDEVESNEEKEIYKYVINSKAYKDDENVRKYLNNVRYWGVELTDSTLQYIATGDFPSAGEQQTEVLVYDSNAKMFLSYLDYTYDDIKSLKVYPIENIERTFKNGNFDTIANNFVYKDNGERNAYNERNIYVNYTGNVVIDGINHYVDEDTHAYTSDTQSISGNIYNGFIKLYNVLEVSVKNTKLSPKTYTKVYSGGSESSLNNPTYDLTIEKTQNVYLNNVTYYCDGEDANCYLDSMLDNSRYGIMNGNYIENLYIDNSKLNGIDISKGVNNLFVTNTSIGYNGINIIGKDYAYFNNVVVDGSPYFINLKTEYGASFEGNIIADNVTFKPGNYKNPVVVAAVNLQNHDYGYKPYLPGIDISGLNIDTSNVNELNYVTTLLLNDKVLDTLNRDVNNSMYDSYVGGHINVENVTLPEGVVMKVFNDQFTGTASNNDYKNYGTVSEGVYSHIYVDVDPKVVVPEGFGVGEGIKFILKPNEVTHNSFTEEEVNSYKTVFDVIRTYDGVQVYKFSGDIKNKKTNIVSIQYIKDTDENLKARYDNASIKEMMSYNSTKSAYAWLENAEDEGKYNLFVGSPENIYLFNGDYIFDGFTNLVSVDFTNLYADRISSLNYMFRDCKNLVDINFADFDSIMMLFTEGLFVGADKIVYMNTEKNVVEVRNEKGLNGLLLYLTYNMALTNEAGDIKLDELAVTGDSLVSEDGKTTMYISVGNDVTGDAKVNVSDVARIYSYVRGDKTMLPNAGYLFAADVTGDDKVIIGDVAKMYSEFRESLRG